MRYRLRTLLILVAAVPPVAAVAYWRFQELVAYRGVAELNATMTANNHFGDVPDNFGGSTTFGAALMLCALLAATLVAITLQRRRAKATISTPR